MEKRYISENRYKRSSGRKRRKVKKITNKSANKTTSKVVKTINKPVKKKIRKRKNARRNNIIVCVVFLIIIAVISRAILKEEGEPFIPEIFKTANEQIITLGVITEENLLAEDTKNILVREMNNYANDVLIRVDEEYNVEYVALDSVNKLSNSEYELIVNKKYVDHINNIKNVLENNDQIENIKDISVSDNVIHVKLACDNPYFIYSLEIPINTNINCYYNLSGSSNENKVVYDREKNANIEIPKQIVITKYKDMYKAVTAYKNNEINMLVTSKSNVQNMLGKYEYNIKSYRNGETLFLFANPKSEVMQDKTVRQSIMFGIDRENIIKEVIDNMGNTIDLPYIYNITKYRYDIYASENILLSNGYTKKNKVYTKDSKVLELTLIVNKEDAEKVEVANLIKNNLSSIGIKINVEKLSEEKLKNRISKGTYDIVLATLNLTKSPDISFVKDNLIGVEGTSLDNVTDMKSLLELNTIQKDMSNNITCIGIYAKTNYVIYDDSVVLLDNISYKNILKDLIVIEK